MSDWYKKYGSTRFRVIGMLKNGEMLTLYDMQNLASVKDVSLDTMRDGLNKLERDGIVEKIDLDKSSVRKRRNNPERKTDYYRLRDGYFCYLTMLYLSNPAMFIPCGYHSTCKETDKCKLVGEVALMFGIPVKDVIRLYPK